MTPQQIGLLLMFSGLLAGGQILFKKAALDMATRESARSGLNDQALAYATNPWFIAAILLYAAITILWVEILKTTPLSRAYPFVALGFVLTPLGAYWLFGEIIGARYLLGTALILLGVSLTTTAPS